MPLGTQWLTAGIAAVVLALVVAWVLFVPAADWLAHHDVGSVTGSLHETALDNARGRLLTLGAGLFAAGALVFTARNFSLSREGQVTDRYTKAIEQLGSDKLDVRIGGIYALERVARDSARDHPTVMEVLTAFIREHSHEQWLPPDPGGQERKRSTRPDVQAALTVVGRRDAKRDIRPVDFVRANLAYAALDGAALGGGYLLHADLHGAYLGDANLNGALLAEANMTDATFFHADLRGAYLTGTTLTRAILVGADLTRASLSGAILADADLTGADISEAILARANLCGANLTRANLTRASLSGAILADADLTGAILFVADLTDADLGSATLTGAFLGGANLTGANLTGADLRRTARWPTDTPVPEGWKLDSSSGRLERAGSDSGKTDQYGGSSE